MNKVNIKEKIIPFFLILAMLSAIVLLCLKTMQNDTFWSIKIGEKLVKEGVWEIDTFSMHSDLKYIAHHFLTDILIYIIYNILGFSGLYIFEILMACGLAIVLYLLNKEICGNKKFAYSLLCLQMVLLTGFIAVRAQMISYILFGIELLLLEKSRKEEKLKYYIGLSIIPLLLVNFHMGAAPFYFVILGVYGLDALKLNFLWIESNTKPNKERFKKLILLGIIGIVLLFVNPYGIEGILYPFKTFGNEFINSYIDEFQPFSVRDSITLLQAFYIMLIIFVFMLDKSKVDLKDMLLIFGTLYMNFTAYRHTSLFIICSAVISKYLYNVIKDIKLETQYKNAFMVIALLMMLVIGVGVRAVTDTEFLVDRIAPVKAVEVLKENMDEDTILYNEYIWGGYLILNDIKVFIDSRCDLYTKEYNENTTVSDDFTNIYRLEDGYKESLAKYNFNMYMVMTDGKTRRVLDEDKTLEIIYSDETATLYKKIK